MRTLRIGLAVVVLAAGAAGAGMYLGRSQQPDLAPPARPLASNLVRLDSPEGQRLLFESDAHQAFLPLATHFVTQKTQAYCGVASIAMVLNALGVPAPMPPEYEPYRLFTQDNILGDLTSDVTTPEKVAEYGMSPEHVAGVLRSYGVEAMVHLAATSSVDEFRALVSEFLKRDGHHVIVNYSRSGLEQEGRGHISPLAAYDAHTDRFLILDVSRYKYPPVWVDADQLYEAMARSVDGRTSGRGFILIRRKRHAAASAISRSEVEQFIGAYEQHLPEAERRVLLRKKKQAIKAKLHQEPDQGAHEELLPDEEWSREVALHCARERRDALPVPSWQSNEATMNKLWVIFWGELAARRYGQTALASCPGTSSRWFRSSERGKATRPAPAPPGRQTAACVAFAPP